MELFLKILDILSLITQFIGAWLMYRNSPINEMPWGTSFDDVVTPKRLKGKNKRLKQGFLILVIGIAIGLISLLIKDFVPSC